MERISEELGKRKMQLQYICELHIFYKIKIKANIKLKIERNRSVTPPEIQILTHFTCNLEA